MLNHRSKVLFVAALAIVAISVLAAVVFGPGISSPELNVLNWDFYIGKRTISDFEKANGVRVHYQIYSSNEDCLGKVRSHPGQYDIIFPSDYMIDILRREGLIEPLERSRLTNIRNIGSIYLGNYYDPKEEYSVPYMFGTTGFAVDRKFVSEKAISWSKLTDGKYKNRIVALDDMRFTLGSVLMELGYSPNTKSPKELDRAVDLLRRVKPNILAFTADTGKQYLLSGSAWIAYAWSGDVLQVQQTRPDVEYIIPAAGSLRFQDGICIPKNSPNRDQAHSFINYLLQPQVSADITNDILYGNTNVEATKHMRPDIRSKPACFPPPGTLKRCEWIKDVGEALELYRKAWEKVKG